MRVLLSLLVLLATLPAATWENISAPLFAKVPDYEEIPAQLYRRLGGIAVLPDSGQIFAVFNRGYGLFTSLDQGASWSKVEMPVQGRLYGGFGFDLDARSGRLALFLCEANSFKLPALGAWTNDRGRTWTAITRPDGRHDGWTWGGVDWSAEQPQTVLGKQHHAYVKMWLSQDGGATWKPLSFSSRNVGVIDATTLVAGVDEHATKRVPAVAAGIYRSTDAGATWNKVSDAVVSGKHPVRWGGTFLWTCAEGVLVSRDAGATWALSGQPVPGALYGPFFGRNERELLVVASDGIFRSDDQGATWRRLADTPAGHYRLGDPIVSYGWDAGRNILYHCPVGGDIHRLALDGP
jgi:photosystem II stability/assembly factor-like uncharacterized protein